MLIVRMVRPVHLMTLRRKKQRVSTGNKNPDFFSTIRAEAHARQLRLPGLLRSPSQASQLPHQLH